MLQICFKFKSVFMQEFTLHFLTDLRRDLIVIYNICLLYTSDAADEARSVDLGGRRIIKNYD